MEALKGELAREQQAAASTRAALAAGASESASELLALTQERDRLQASLEDARQQLADKAQCVLPPLARVYPPASPSCMLCQAQSSKGASLSGGSPLFPPWVQAVREASRGGGGGAQAGGGGTRRGARREGQPGGAAAGPSGGEAEVGGHAFLLSGCMPVPSTAKREGALSSLALGWSALGVPGRADVVPSLALGVPGRQTLFGRRWGSKARRGRS